MGSDEDRGAARNGGAYGARWRVGGVPGGARPQCRQGLAVLRPPAPAQPLKAPPVERGRGPPPEGLHAPRTGCPPQTRTPPAAPRAQPACPAPSPPPGMTVTQAHCMLSRGPTSSAAGSGCSTRSAGCRKRRCGGLGLRGRELPTTQKLTQNRNRAPGAQRAW